MEVLQQQRVRVLALSKIRQANRVYCNSLEKLLLSFSFLLSCTRYEQEYIGPSQPWIQVFVDLQKIFTSMGASQAVDLNFIISINQQLFQLFNSNRSNFSIMSFFFFFERIYDFYFLFFHNHGIDILPSLLVESHLLDMDASKLIYCC